MTRLARNPEMDWSEVDDVMFACANQAGEDNSNPTRTMAEVRIKAAWLKVTYRDNPRSEFTEEEQDALLQSFFDLDA